MTTMLNEIDAPLKLVDLISLHDSGIMYFTDIWTRAEENERIKRVEHWTDQEKLDFEAQGRQAYSIGLTATKLNQFLASQRMNRTSYRVEATIDPNDEVKAEIATIQLRDIERRCDLKYNESDVFDAGVSIAYGVDEITVGKDNMLNTVVNVTEVDYRNFVWDSNAVSYSKDDALFEAKIDKCYRYQLEEEYGKQKVDELSPMSEMMTWGRDKVQYWVKFNHGGKSDFDIISKITHYQKVLRDCYVVLFNDFQNVHGSADSVFMGKFRSKKEAEKLLRELKYPYLKNYGIDPGGEIVKKRETRLDKYVFTYEGILEYEETDLETFPFSIYQAFHFKDKFWTLTDILKSPQKWFDRLFAQIDYAFGKDIKNTYEIIIGNLASGETLETAIQKLEDGVPIGVKAPNTVSAIKSQGANPQWGQMAQTMQSLIEDMSGGRSFQGLKESAGESGRAINLKMQQGEMIALLFLDNLRRFKRDLGYKLLWFLRHYDTAERIVKIAGGELSEEMFQLLQNKGLLTPSRQTPGAGYVRVNTEEQGVAFLKDFSYELVIEDEPMSESQRERKLSMMMLQEQTNPELQSLPEWLELKMQYLGISHTERVKLIGAYRERQAQQAALQKQELDLERAKVMQQGLTADKKMMSEEKMAKMDIESRERQAKQKPKNKPKSK